MFERKWGMKKFLISGVRFVLLGPPALILVLAPYLAMLFGISLIPTGIAGWGFGVEWAATYAFWGWIAYAILGVLTPWLVASFTYKIGPIGIAPFHHHFREVILGEWRMGLYSTILWPWGWICLEYNYRGWELHFDAVVLNTWEYWAVDRRRGMKMEYIDRQLGGTRETRVKSMDEAARQIRNSLPPSDPTVN